MIFWKAKSRKQLKSAKLALTSHFAILFPQIFSLVAKEAKPFFYTLNHKNLIVKQLKVIGTIAQLNGLLKKLKPLVSKIILFGSSSRGRNTPDSA